MNVLGTKSGRNSLSWDSRVQTHVPESATVVRPSERESKRKKEHIKSSSGVRVVFSHDCRTPPDPNWSEPRIRIGDSSVRPVLLSYENNGSGPVHKCGSQVPDPPSPYEVFLSCPVCARDRGHSVIGSWRTVCRVVKITSSIYIVTTESKCQ